MSLYSFNAWLVRFVQLKVSRRGSMYQNAASCFILYETVKIKAMCYILTRSDFDFQSFIYFYYKNNNKKNLA